MHVGDSPLHDVAGAAGAGLEPSWLTAMTNTRKILTFGCKISTKFVHF